MCHIIRLTLQNAYRSLDHGLSDKKLADAGRELLPALALRGLATASARPLVGSQYHVPLTNIERELSETFQRPQGLGQGLKGIDRSEEQWRRWNDSTPIQAQPQPNSLTLFKMR